MELHGQNNVLPFFGTGSAPQEGSNPGTGNTLFWYGNTFVSTRDEGVTPTAFFGAGTAPERSIPDGLWACGGER